MIIVLAMAGGFSPATAEAETTVRIEAAGSEPVQSGDHFEGIEIRGGEARPRRAAV